MSDSNINCLVGEILTEINNFGGERLDFETKSGRKFSMFHEQDCCESVRIEKIRGKLKDLLESPIIEATEEISYVNPKGFFKEYQDSFTWTTFILETIDHKVVIRWYGESNGYYSESVSFVENK